MKDDSQTRRQLLARIAWMCYEKDLTQAEIADKLGLSRVTVNRMLKEARETGLVEIKVHTEFSDSFELSFRLIERFGLLDVVIVPSASEGEDLQSLLARGAISVLSHRLQPGMTVGIGVGRTISFLPDHLVADHPLKVQFISLTGGLDFQQGVPHTFDIITRLAILMGGEAVYIPAPSYLNDASAHDVIMQQPAVINTLQIAAKCDMAFFSIGSADYSAMLFRLRYLSEKDMAELKRKEAVGDVLGRYYNAQGKQLDLNVNKRIIGLQIEELKQIPLKVLVAGGAGKEKALTIALEKNFCDILVTDEEMAKFLLKER